MKNENKNEVEQEDKHESLLEKIVHNVKDFIDVDFPLSGAEGNESLEFHHKKTMEYDERKGHLAKEINHNFPLSGGA